MVTRDMLRMRIKEKKVVSGKKIRVVTVLDLIKCLKQIKWQRLLLTYAPISELPSNISTVRELEFPFPCYFICMNIFLHNIFLIRFFYFLTVFKFDQFKQQKKL